MTLRFMKKDTIFCFGVRVTFACLRISFEGESFGARASVTSGCVSTHAVVAQQPIHQTLVNV